MKLILLGFLLVEVSLRVVYKWKRMKGVKSDNVCSKCKRVFQDDEFDLDEDTCCFVCFLRLVVFGLLR